MTFIGRWDKAAIRATGALAMPLICLTAIAVPAASSAQTSASATGGDRLIAQIINCRGITEPHRRLECYDRQVIVLAEARESRAVVVLSRSDITEKKRESFGLQQPVVTALDRRDGEEPEITGLDSTVRRVGPSGRDRLTIHLADGSVWQTLERARISPDVGDGIHIRRAALGSFIGSYEGGSIRLKRLR